MSKQMLSGWAASYGKNSNDYKMAGGVKKSERKRRASIIENETA